MGMEMVWRKSLKASKQDSMLEPSEAERKKSSLKKLVPDAISHRKP